MLFSKPSRDRFWFGGPAFGALRQARRDWHRTRHLADEHGEVRELDRHDDPAGDEADIVVERSWRYVGSGYFDTETAARALTAAALAREHRAR